MPELHYRAELKGPYSEAAAAAFVKVTGEGPDGAHIPTEDLPRLMRALAPFIKAPCASAAVSVSLEVCE